MSLIEGKQVTKGKYDDTCPFCGQKVVENEPTCASEGCVEEWAYMCKEMKKEENDMNCNENNREYPHKGMTPVELDNPIDRKWRQIRDKANKDIAVRTALVEFDEAINDRAKEIEAEMVEMMTLGGLHPGTKNCMGDYA